uniref:Protein cereblon n=1 Tax=Ciona savignyi TaxID=51511 RepID=H2YDD6_CIOSA
MESDSNDVELQDQDQNVDTVQNGAANDAQIDQLEGNDEAEQQNDVGVDVTDHHEESDSSEEGDVPDPEEESSEEEEDNAIGVGRWRNILMHIRGGGHFPRFQNVGRWRGWIERQLRRNIDNSDPEDEDETNKITTPTNITYDQNLPTSHSYLGEMEDCSGVPYQKEDSYITMPIMYVSDFVLIPGQTLPLQITRFNEVSMIQRVIDQEDKTFGVLTKKPGLEMETTKPTNLYDFGCTAEIRSFRETNEHEITQLRIVAVGRQRFQVMEKRTQIDGNVLAKVKIISDAEHPSLNRNLGFCKNCHGKSIKGKESWAQLRRESWVTAWPPWVHRMYDVDFLRFEIFKELKEWNGRLVESQCPDSATDFSFWVVTMIPLTVERRLFLLQLHSAIQRLRCELNMLRKSTTLHCSYCSLRIADRKEVFSMSFSGPMAAYVNPGGVHETLTLYKTTNLEHVGRRTTEHSWFPGYAWTICECRRCRQHIGWKFTASDSHLVPQKFWGLTRSALSPQVAD